MIEDIVTNTIAKRGFLSCPQINLVEVDLPRAGCKVLSKPKFKYTDSEFRPIRY